MQSGGELWVDPDDRWGWRAPVLVVLVVITMLAGAMAVTLGWSRATLISTDGYVSALIEPLVNDPAVKDAVAKELAHEMTETMGTNISGQISQWVPPGAVLARQAIEQFATQIEDGWRQGLEPSIRTQLDLPSFNALWIEANREAHRQLIDALSDGRTGTTVTLDLHEIAQAAVRETGVQLDRQLNLPGNIGTTVYAAAADALPPEAGRISIDVSRISSEARMAISLVDPLFIGSLGIGAFFALVAVGVAPRRRRGTAVIILGLGALVVAGGLWLSITKQAEGAGDKIASVAVEPLSPEMRLVVDREVQLAVDSFQVWATGAAAVGGALVLIGGIWRIASGRARPQEPAPASGYPAQDWSTPGTPPWSSRAY
jgi:hypothetical protein